MADVLWRTLYIKEWVRNQSKSGRLGVAGAVWDDMMQDGYGGGVTDGPGGELLSSSGDVLGYTWQTLALTGSIETSAVGSGTVFIEAANNPAPAPAICGGTFTFAGKEIDAGEAGGFIGAIHEYDSVNGNSSGVLTELWGGGEGGLLGGGKITSTQSPTGGWPRSAAAPQRSGAPCLAFEIWGSASVTTFAFPMCSSADVTRPSRKYDLDEGCGR